MESVLQPNLTTTLAAAGIDMFKSFVIRSTDVTPSLRLMPQKEYLLIKGVSCSEDVSGFYRQVLELLDAYAAMDKDRLTLYFKFEKYDTNSVQYIFQIMKRIEILAESGMDVDVVWYYKEGNESMKEMGENLRDLFELQVNLNSYFPNWMESERPKSVL